MPTIEATEMNLRFPGQYWDRETQTHYNFNRDYLPGLGRYAQLDPIGIAGGVNAFAYVSARPNASRDPWGLVEWSGSVTGGGVVSGAGLMVMYFNLESECLCNRKVKIKGYAIFAAVGMGLKYTVNSGGATFYDNLSCPSEGAASGPAAGASAGIVTVGGAAISATALGSMRSTWPPLSTGLVGVDISAVAMIGWSFGSGTTEECCHK